MTDNKLENNMLWRLSLQIALQVSQEKDQLCVPLKFKISSKTRLY